MTKSGGCYCGEVKYEVSGAPLMKGQCHCRECQYIAGGGPHYYVALRAEDLRFTAGSPATFRRPDLEHAVVRSFCATCGTHILTQRHDFKGVILKTGTLDDPASFGGPQVAIFTKDAQPFHHIPDALPCFESLPDW